MSSLDEVCDIRRKTDVNSELYIGLEHIGQGNNVLISRGNTKDFKSTKNSFKKGDILYGKLRPLLNKVHLATENGYCSTDILPLRVNDKISAGFLLRVLTDKRFLSFAISTSSGTKMPRTNWSDIKDFKLLLPPPQEQEEISAMLSEVDELIQKTEQLIEYTQRLKKGLTQKLLTRGIGHKKFKTICLGSKAISISIPESWEIKLLCKIAKIIDVRHSTPKYTTQGFPLVLPNNVDSEGLDLRNTKFTNKEDYLYMTDGGRKPSKGDIIYSRNATFGVACRVEDEIEFSLGQDLVLIKPEKIDPYLLYLILNSRSTLVQLTRLSTGSTFQRINLELIRNYIIPYAKDTDEQKKISQILERTSNIIYVSNRTRMMLNRLKVGLMQKLLTGNIRVKV